MKPPETEAKRHIFITGPPRTGKTTLILKVAEELRKRGYKLGGMVSQEIREEGVRVGFEIRDYASGKRGWLAHIRQPEGPRIGKYRANINEFNSVGVSAVKNALKDADVVLIDEIGPMELFSEAFIEVVQKAVSSPKSILGTLHYRSQHPLIKQIKARKDVFIVEAARESHDRLLALIMDKIIRSGSREGL